MSTKRSLMKGSTGLNTVVDPVRVDYDWRTGITDLSVALNVTISPSGRVDRRKGKTKKVSLDSRSMFCDGGECIFVSDANLYLLGTDLTSYRLLGSLSNNDRLACVQVGSRIYYTNNLDLGYVENGVKYAWEKTTDYVGPTTRKVFTGPFAGNHLAFRDGRMYISKDNHLWYSHYQAVDWYDMARNYLKLNSHIRMMKPVQNGLYVSDSKAIYFYSGATPPEFKKVKLTTYPALEWSDAIDYVDGEDIPELGFKGPCAWWVTTEGAMVGSPEGVVKNVNREKVIYPKGTRGSSLVRGLNFIHTIE